MHYVMFGSDLEPTWEKVEMRYHCPDIAEKGDHYCPHMAQGTPRYTLVAWARIALAFVVQTAASFVADVDKAAAGLAVDYFDEDAWPEML